MINSDKTYDQLWQEIINTPFDPSTDVWNDESEYVYNPITDAYIALSNKPILSVEDLEDEWHMKQYNRIYGNS
jgi:hypothetical protein